MAPERIERRGARLGWSLRWAHATRRPAGPGAAALRAPALLAMLVAVAAALGGCDGNAPGKQGSGTGGTTASGELPKDLREVADEAESVGCTVEAPDQEEPEHVEDAGDLEFSSDPPSSGPHFPLWARWGFYEKPVHDGYVVHNMEHGGVVAWLGDDVSEEQRDAIEQDVLDARERWLVTPREDFEGVAAAAWGALLRCEQDAVAKLEVDGLSKLLDSWYAAVNGRGTEEEGDLPAVSPPPEALEEYPDLPQPPAPTRDVTDTAVRL